MSSADAIRKPEKQKIETHCGPVDVIMCTWNSNKPYFERCLRSVKREVPIHHFIVVDRFSEDGTLDSIRKYFNPVVIRSKDNLARARMAGISLVDTECLFFVDDDVELPMDYFKRMLSYLDRDVGAVHEQKLWIGAMGKQVSPKWVNWAYKRKARIIDVTKDNALKYRGQGHSTLVRTAIVKDWKPNSMICAYEDYHLMRYIVNKGFIWRIVDKCTILHHTPRTISDHFKKTRWDAAGVRVTGAQSLVEVLRRSIKGSVEAFINSIRRREPLILAFALIESAVFLNGYLRWNRFLVLER